MTQPETNTRKIIARLKAEGWMMRDGGRHSLFTHPDRPQTLIPVPRHRELTPMTARSIAKAAGWN
ncbi:MAG: type II toxin-antitoxin system HicA family toxin [Rhizobiales bacterium]|nr:type II toxin-antitoxin system HicA family toxin [Hyphomicrobiales bacterium]